jgi:hypothetical protein
VTYDRSQNSDRPADRQAPAQAPCLRPGDAVSLAAARQPSGAALVNSAAARSTSRRDGTPAYLDFHQPQMPGLRRGADPLGLAA